MKNLLKLIYWSLLAKIKKIQLYDPFNSLKFDLEGFIELIKIFNMNYSILVKYKHLSYSPIKGILNLNAKEEVLEKDFDLILSIIDFHDSNNQFFKEIHDNK